MKKSSEYKLKDIPRISSRVFSAATGMATNNEEFAEDKWQIHVLNYLEIKVDVEMNGFRKRSLNSWLAEYGFIRVERNSKISFKVELNKNIYNSGNIRLYWKVRNVGKEAIRMNCIRGQIKLDKIYKEEEIRFAGPHFVEVYGVSDDTVIAFGRVEVPLHGGDSLS
ncbi:hypothetical protein ACFQ4L_06850 [Lapidilactobacillus mulanensis]|uniref:Adenylyl/Guanylyl and SMODS C-terminal sensor domain-containing protein n=1 Tax=Lapidilactobacillus mulanensis TaxID=2485999 RepID=A0ABW4DP17_9LACO|nr:hypothetical protein [Lapidilactobacillus mulanensis]